MTRCCPVCKTEDVLWDSLADKFCICLKCDATGVSVERMKPCMVKVTHNKDKMSDAELFLHCQTIATSVMDGLTHNEIKCLEIAIFNLAKKYRGEL